MPDFNVIADVSETLRGVLDEGLSSLTPAPPPVVEVHDLQGTISTSPARVTLFLFEVVEDPSLRNRPHRRRENPPDVEMTRPPIPLLLRYLITPWGGDRTTEHRILGRVLQVFYEDAVLSGTQLQGGLANTSEALKLTLAPLSLEDRTRIWHAVQKPYHLSLSYEVRVVNLEPEDVRRVRPVGRRSLRPAVPEAGPAEGGG